MSTSWARVFLLFLVGATVALLLGKAAVALPILKSEFELSLFEAGLLVSIFSLMAAAFAAIFGATADRFGQRRIATLGLIIAVLASTSGAMATDTPVLLASRVFEGLGVFLVSTAIPPLMLQITAARDHQKVMGLWGAFVPAGLATVMLCGGLVADVIGWRGLWLVTSTCLLIAMATFLWVTRNIVLDSGSRSTASLFSTYSILLLPGPLLMALLFVGYSAQFMIVTAFLPLILVDRFGWAIADAGIAAGLVVAFNILGNVASGVLLDRGFKRRTVLLVAIATMGLGTIAIFSDMLPIAGRLASAAVFAAVGGLLPGALFAGVSVHSPHPSRLSAVNGLLLQGAALGQFCGPPFAALFVSLTDQWSGIVLFTIPIALVTGIFAVLLGNLERAK